MSRSKHPEEGNVPTRVGTSPYDSTTLPLAQLTSFLAERVLGWGVAPDRFLTGKRQWLPRWRFQPERTLADAFLLLETAKPEHYAMSWESGGKFKVSVEIAGRNGEAQNVSKPLAITLAVALALGLRLEDH